MNNSSHITLVFNGHCFVVWTVSSIEILAEKNHCIRYIVPTVYCTEIVIHFQHFRCDITYPKQNKCSAHITSKLPLVGSKNENSMYKRAVNSTCSLIETNGNIRT